jgi:lysophospholipase L1-like esterase
VEGLKQSGKKAEWERGWSRPNGILSLTVTLATLILGVLSAARWCRPDGAPSTAVDSFASSLHSLETEHSRKVRILHFGDSHIASDTESSVVRSYLQNMFGDAGPGLTLPWDGPRLTSLNITYGNTYGWQRYHPTYSTPVEDTGLALSYIEATSPHQAAWLETSGSEFRVYFLSQPEGGDAEFILDGTLIGTRKMNAAYPRVDTVEFQAVGPDARHRFEIRTTDFGRVRILGVSVERSAPGVVYSALGMVGARAEYLLKCREETFNEQVTGEHPDLIILGYGTNETSGSNLDEKAYDAALSTIVSRLHRAAPAALVIILTPPDRGDSRPGQAEHYEQIIRQITAVERRVAERDGAVVVDLYTAMGGAGSAERWAYSLPALARPDMTHFTNEGYNLLGRYIVGGIMKLYDSGAEAAVSYSNASWEDKSRLSSLLPPLYPAMVPAAVHYSSPQAGNGFLQEPSAAPPQVYYYLMDDGQIVVTNDLSTIDSRHGKSISAEEASCVLRGKSSPCENAAR